MPYTRFQRMLGTDKPIGMPLAENQTETFREILRVGRNRRAAARPISASTLGRAHLPHLSDRGPGQPMIRDHGEFPADSFRELPACHSAEIVVRELPGVEDFVKGERVVTRDRGI